MPSIFEHGLYCESCESFVHSFFTTPKLESIKEHLNKLAEVYRVGKDRGVLRRLRRERKQFQIKHDKVQREVRKEMGMPAEGKVVWRKEEGVNSDTG